VKIFMSPPGPSQQIENPELRGTIPVRRFQVSGNDPCRSLAWMKRDPGDGYL
jgi:hypothetical protein